MWKVTMNEIEKRIINICCNTQNKDIMQTTCKRYIRFGDIPENEVSGVWCDTIKVREEKGVSVYDAVMIDNQWRILLPHTLKKEVGFDLYNFIGGTENGNIPMYLVEGNEVGSGTTNEPLLKNVRIIQKLL